MDCWGAHAAAVCPFAGTTVGSMDAGATVRGVAFFPIGSAMEQYVISVGDDKLLRLWKDGVWTLGGHVAEPQLIAGACGPHRRRQSAHGWHDRPQSPPPHGCVPIVEGKRGLGHARGSTSRS